MKQSAFANYDNRDAHELWCDTMIKKARLQRRRAVGVMKSRQTVVEPRYTNYELKKLFLELTF